MDQRTYILVGDPIPLCRPRFSRWAVYDSQKHQKLVAGINLRNQHGENPFFAGPLHLHVVFFMGFPQATSNKKKKELEGTPHTRRPDISNCLKFVEDICNGILFADDSLISHVTCDKLYSIRPRTEITIRELNGENKKQ